MGCQLCLEGAGELRSSVGELCVPGSGLTLRSRERHPHSGPSDSPGFPARQRRRASMNLHLEVEIFSEIFYLKPRGGKKIENGNSRCKTIQDSSPSRKLECVLKPSLLTPQLGLRRRQVPGAAGRWAGPAQLVRRVRCAPGRILPRCTPARAPLGASAGTQRRNDTGSPGKEHVALTGDPRWRRRSSVLPSDVPPAGS